MLENLIKRQGSRTSFESVVRMDPQTPPGLPAATLHPRPMSIADPLREWYATSVHDPHVRAHVSDAPSPPPPAPPHGGDDDSSSSSESDVKRKKKKASSTRSRTRKCACLNTLTLSHSNRGGVPSGRPLPRLAVINKSLAKRGLVLAGRQIPFLIYREFAKGAHQTDCTSYVLAS